MDYDRMRELVRLMRGTETLPATMLPLLDAMIERSAALEARAECERQFQEKAQQVAELEEQVQSARALGAQARQAADERREMLERVSAELAMVLNVPRGAAEADVLAVTAAQEIRTLRTRYGR
jgi:hypothetical protein